VIHLLSQKRNINDYYQIGSLLGSGANGQVFSGIHLTKGHEVAIKLTDMRHCHFTSGTADGTGNSPADRVLKEAHMLRTLVHPQIIHLEDVFITNTSLYMVMELVKGPSSLLLHPPPLPSFSLSLGGDLFDRVVARGRFNEENVPCLALSFLSLCDGLMNLRPAW
jgi:serine/threonine protein kinase